MNLGSVLPLKFSSLQEGLFTGFAVREGHVPADISPEGGCATRLNASLTMIPTGAVLFGGRLPGTGTLLCDTWRFATKTMTWQVPETKGDLPLARENHSAVYDAKIHW